MPQPSKIPLAFAASGDKNAIPESTETTGLASWRDGFPAITSAPFSEGGIAPKRADFNGIFNALSLATLWQQQGGFYAYDATTDYEIGNVVEYNGDLYKCLSANGPSSAVKAPTDATVWSKVMTAADVAALYLPLSGGTLSNGTNSLLLRPGLIELSASQPFIDFHHDNSSADHTARIINDQNGRLVVSVQNDTNTQSKNFNLNIDGTLTWDGKNVETNVSNTTAYYRLSNGLQILTGDASSSSSGAVTVNFAHAFAEYPRVMITPYGINTTQFAPRCTLDTTSFDFVCVGTNNNYINGASVRWLAFGIGA